MKNNAVIIFINFKYFCEIKIKFEITMTHET